MLPSPRVRNSGLSSPRTQLWPSNFALQCLWVFSESYCSTNSTCDSMLQLAPSGASRLCPYFIAIHYCIHSFSADHLRGLSSSHLLVTKSQSLPYGLNIVTNLPLKGSDFVKPYALVSWIHSDYLGFSFFLRRYFTNNFVRKHTHITLHGAYTTLWSAFPCSN